MKVIVLFAGRRQKEQKKKREIGKNKIGGLYLNYQMRKNRIDVEKFIKGICFMCKRACDSQAYIHYECSVAYSEEKAKRIKEANDKNI